MFKFKWSERWITHRDKLLHLLLDLSRPLLGLPPLLVGLGLGLGVGLRLLGRGKLTKFAEFVSANRSLSNRNNSPR